jgi:hypothetical protein
MGVPWNFQAIFENCLLEIHYFYPLPWNFRAIWEMTSPLPRISKGKNLPPPGISKVFPPPPPVYGLKEGNVLCANVLYFCMRY